MKGISEERWVELEHLESLDPGTKFSVILTLGKNASSKILEKSGLEVKHAMIAQQIVTGKASLESLRRLAALPEVELIEEDGIVRAIGD